ncbi:pyridoxamine 5'-phosphate oxidase family protein [Bacillus suaedaesalsae]|uniref:Pyridoxamine 5'-phosphate oxidase family protein n=1 Tax=Bacillus suaedaesalsae TaxID=2810349 RepID=A0ABS2DJC7_9BACI|nr:pyridoxamine 5'-phosphate oxidase family protein [Bacillus suaedaesalsae]MBM6618602.1 pyridoxamine 5'-phosphate oxidase family protein [Bacillus suaedaesalsae]
MANQVESMLISSLYDFLQRERFVTISTIDHVTGGPNVSAISWVYAPDQRRIVFAVDNRSRIIQNIKNIPLIVMNVVANDSTYSIYGEAVIKNEKVEDVPLKLALVEIKISEVRDVMFYGAKISIEPRYEKTYDAEAATRLDRQVMEAIKNN